MSTTATAPIDTHVESPLAHLSEEQLDQLGREFDAIRDRVMAELGDRDRRYIESMIEMQRRLAVLGRILLLASRNRAGWWAGTASLSAAKILENMEIGHNVMHGQWDWMNDPDINAAVWEWDSVCPSDQWKHGHNVVHHTWTNVRGMDRDIGYEILRTTSATPWHPAYLAQPIYNALLGLLFEWGVGVHEIDFRRLPGATPEERATQLELFRGFVRKAGRQVA
ncbi:MAG: fatty acid desaturase family protein, partial [Solirubrobacterales bacterium]